MDQEKRTTNEDDMGQMIRETKEGALAYADLSSKQEDANKHLRQQVFIRSKEFLSTVESLNKLFGDDNKEVVNEIREFVENNFNEEVVGGLTEAIASNDNLNPHFEEVAGKIGLPTSSE